MCINIVRFNKENEYFDQNTASCFASATMARYVRVQHKRCASEPKKGVTSPKKRKSHIGLKLNKWDPERMKNAIEEYHRQQSGNNLAILCTRCH